MTCSLIGCEGCTGCAGHRCINKEDLQSADTSSTSSAHSTSIRVVSSTLLPHCHGPVRFLTTNVIRQGSSWQYEGLAVLLVLLESLKFRSILTVRAQATCGIESSNEWACEVMWSQERYFSYRNQACCKRDSIAPCFRPQFWTDIGPFSAVERTNLLTTAKCIL